MGNRASDADVGLRHYFASLLIADGADVKILKQQVNDPWSHTPKYSSNFRR